MHYWKTLFQFIPKYLLIQNSSFQDNARTKVYALDDSLGVVFILFKKRKMKALICLRGWAGRSAPLLFANPKDRVSRVKTHLRFIRQI